VVLIYVRLHLDAGITTTYTWNARNQLTGISRTGLTASFTYDSFGRRTGKTINGTTTNFLYGVLNPVQEKNGGTVTANLLTGLGIDDFFTRTDSVGVRALLPDALGSTVTLGDNTGALQTQYTYEPFGVTTQTGAASTNSYKYTGREEDGTGLMYYRARYYSPRMARFASEDPIGLLGGDVNLYAYVGNNPINHTDPDGNQIRPFPPGWFPKGPPPPRPNIGRNDPQLHRPLEPQPVPPGKDLIPKTPAWMRFLKRLAGDDSDLDVTMPGVVCIDIGSPAGVPVPLGGRKNGSGVGSAQGPNKPIRHCYFDDGTT
jgi:RHS repeat-associated protein